MPTLAATIVLALGIVVVALWRLVRSSPALVPSPPPDDAPMVSVIVPVRNEERNVLECLESLLPQAYPAFEVIVVDDGSTDTTPDLLAAAAAGRNPRLRVVHGEAKPDGWNGKSFAVVQGVAAAQGEWLMIVDADVRLAPGGMSATMCAAREHGVALLSMWPRHDLQTFAERSVHGVVLTMHYLGDAFQRLRRPWTWSAGPANGQFVLVERAGYEAVGGHAAVRGSMLEDYALSRRLREAGFTAVHVDGKRVSSVRMYTSLREIWAGWSRNTLPGMRQPVLETIGGVLATAVVCLGPLLLGLWALAEVLRGEALPALPLAAVAWLLLATAFGILGGLTPRPWSHLFSYPLGGIVLIGILLDSLARHRLGSVGWKGRQYRTPSGRTPDGRTVGH